MEAYENDLLYTTVYDIITEEKCSGILIEERALDRQSNGKSRERGEGGGEKREEQDHRLFSKNI
jgi:hypothetical protein